jgi:hypothetical protein
MRVEAATGQSWIDAHDGGAQHEKLTTAIMVGMGGAVTTMISGAIFKDAVSSYIAINPEYTRLLNEMTTWGSKIDSAQKSISFFSKQAQLFPTDTVAPQVVDASEKALQTAVDNYTNASTMLKSTPMHLKKSIWPMIGSGFGVAVGLAMMVYGITTIVKIANSYKVEYLDIPLNMIDCVDTENGNRFVRYRVVNSFYEDDGEVKTRPGDTNGYDGQQWNAIYYTKSYEAGKCLLSKVDFPQNEKDFGKYTPVHEFGKVNVCYNLNKYTHRNSLTSSTTDYAQEVFLAFQNSNAKKAAETEVPSIVGSILNYGIVAVSCVVGIGIGMGIMTIVNKKNNKKKEISQ